ncbi:DEHA2F14872p [Debaryomyces hansenii CBS767]|jgi:membrane-associated progesterone receptor component|uniref:DEHA2F14872p n=1 Tax=Debaryomyces hansenii (strain ATCC 36239 / CBS 767 / BCRC 21394 / JCM 1990 / NBRC 0083 / IGC 2968) TaxID=284592 RepID=Q6BLB4_DEBHA|nr:DEHA2F14872p [Debaryomyces hansenii CBS767]CAG89377.1 DEHA2F14872p [Debaryomyces hansenii CBS767]|eukprot:XP_461007.1 DEHA2F14872p [Debaryomyces hansenii CBS767]
MIATILVVLFVAYLLRNVFSGIEISNPNKGETAETIVEGKFTPVSLAKYNGSDDPKIFIAVRNRVFNVTMGAAFYGPGGPYENFAGRDASRGLSKNSFELECLTPVDQPIDPLDNLTSDEIESLDSWEEHFENKYPVVGTLHENDTV